MTGTAAVRLSITIPTKAEEERLKKVYVQVVNGEVATPMGIASRASTIESLSTIRIGESPELKSHKVLNSLPKIQIQTCHDQLLDIPLDTDQEQVVRQILQKFHIPNAVWLPSLEGNAYHISFSMDFDERYENLYEALQEFGIGDREGSAVSVVSCLAHRSYVQREETEEQEDQPSSTEHINAQKQGIWDRFMNSVRSRLNVAQIVRDVRQDAAITFDFCILLVSAAVLASFGLVENSTIFLASSMLISPLMGPIIAAIFGTVIQDRSLRRLGMLNELIGILTATLVGFLFGLVVCTTDRKYGIGEGLTEEMLSRCDLHSLVVGVFTAIPSGAAAAIGILGGNIGSLVGVAISASLLPPAVNSGLLWAVACIYKIFENDDSLYVDVIKSRRYSDNQAKELAVLGGISMCLTLSNVLCVYLMGILVLKVKEIAPVIGRKNRQFWKHDIKLARNGKVETESEILNELIANLATEDKHALGSLNRQFLRHLDESNYQHTWSPLSNRHSFSMPQPPGAGISTIHRLEQLYASRIGINPPAVERRQRHSVVSRPSQRSHEVSVQLSPPQPRPRFASMPSQVGKDEPAREAAMQVASSKRFTVTPARVDEQT
ncbi:GD22247 [Drosophila simulans]|uniref:GD22247 n=1 Tax=Drosophila simulans TaxID=7240 RepID=B4Q9C3_DROSI|nr:GD22247 [Drosophila simulans]